MSLPLRWQLAHFFSNRAAAFSAGGGCFREQPESARIPAKKAKVIKLKVERGTFIKLAAPKHRGRSMRDAMRAVNGHNFRVEKGKDSSRLSLSGSRCLRQHIPKRLNRDDGFCWLVGRLNRDSNQPVACSQPTLSIWLKGQHSGFLWHPKWRGRYPPLTRGVSTAIV